MWPATRRKQFYFIGRMAFVNYLRNTLEPGMEEYLLSLNLLDDGEDDAKKRLHLQIIKNIEVIYGKGKITQSHLDLFGKDGLKDLATAILRDEAIAKSHQSSDDTTSSVAMVRFKVAHHNTEFELPWHYKLINADGQPSSLLDLRHETSDGASLLSEYIEASCGGNCSCSTCHVYIDSATTTDSKQAIELSPVTEAEQDMLDLAYEPNERSRLACQVRLLKVPSTTGSPVTPIISVTIPSGVNDMWK